MAKRYFKKKNKVKKGANLPPGKIRLKGLGRDVVPMFRMSRYTSDPDVDNHDKEANKRLANICNNLLDDPSVLARTIVIKRRREMINEAEKEMLEKADEAWGIVTPECEDEE